MDATPLAPQGSVVPPQRRGPLRTLLIIGGVVVLVVGAALAGLVMVGMAARGTRVTFGNDEEIYYKDGTTEAEARKLGDCLKTMGFFGKGGRTVQLGKEGAKYQVSFVVKDGAWNDASICTGFMAMGALISIQAFDNQPVTVHLCDDKLERKKSLP